VRRGVASGKTGGLEWRRKMSTLTGVELLRNGMLPKSIEIHQVIKMICLYLSHSMKILLIARIAPDCCTGFLQSNSVAASDHCTDYP
jgi:hypothetical protein